MCSTDVRRNSVEYKIEKTLFSFPSDDTESNVTLDKTEQLLHKWTVQNDFTEIRKQFCVPIGESICGLSSLKKIGKENCFDDKMLNFGPANMCRYG